MSWWNVIFAPLAVIIAFGKGRSMILWGIITAFCGFWSLLVVALLPQREIRLPESIKNLLLNRWIRQEMKGINSPADL